MQSGHQSLHCRLLPACHTREVITVGAGILLWLWGSTAREAGREGMAGQQLAPASIAAQQGAAAAPSHPRRRLPPLCVLHRWQLRRQLACRAAQQACSCGDAEAGAAHSSSGGSGRRQLLLAGSCLLLGAGQAAAAAAVQAAASAASSPAAGSSNRGLAELVAAAKPSWPASTAVGFPNYARAGPYQPTRLPPLEHTCACMRVWLSAAVLH